jgi:hypothetical protein
LWRDPPLVFNPNPLLKAKSNLLHKPLVVVEKRGAYGNNKLKKKQTQTKNFDPPLNKGEGSQRASTALIDWLLEILKNLNCTDRGNLGNSKKPP